MVSHTIISALQSKLITDICLSTDSVKLKNIGKRHGLTVPFLRSKRLSSSTALTIDVVKDAITRFEKYYKKSYEYILLLQPTCPFRKKNIIDESIKTLIKKKSFDSLLTVCDVGSHHPYRMKFMNKDNLVRNVIDQGFEDMRPIQKLQKAYIRSGSIYLCKKEVIYRYNSLVGKSTYGKEVKGKYTINIDTNEDFNLAKKYLR